MNYKFILDFTSYEEFKRHFSTERRCVKYLEKRFWNGRVKSPFAPKAKVYRLGLGKYRCGVTGKDFSIRYNTIFAGSKVPLVKWFNAIYLLCSFKKGINSIQLAEMLKIEQKTAWRMSTLIRKYLFKVILTEKFDGEVEVDETFVGGKNKNRHWDKKVPRCQGRSFKDKTPVLGILERNGWVVCKVLKDTTYKSLTAPILKAVKKDAKAVYSDEWGGYRTIHKVYNHCVVDHGHGIYVNGGAYTNTIEAFWSNYCKRPLVCTYNKVSKKKLQLYFNEFSFRYNHRKVNGIKRFEIALTQCVLGDGQVK